MSNSSDPALSVGPLLDVAVLKSWDFAGWRAQYGEGTLLPYRIDELERYGMRLLWTDAIHQEGWQRSRLGAAVRRAEAATVPSAQTVLMASAIRRSPVTLAMFESEANLLAMCRRTWPRSSRSVFAVLTCWLAHLVTTASRSRLSAYRWAYRSVDRLYYLSVNQGPILADGLHISPERLRYIPFGVDTEAFRPTGEPDDGYLLVVGRDRGRDWTTLFAAVGALDIPVKVCCRMSDIAGHDIPGNVEVLGYVDRRVYRSLLGRARVVAIASHPVVYPTGQSVMLEAMAMGRLVVVTKTEAIEGYLDDGRTCLGVPVGDPAAMRDAIWVAVTDDDLRCRIGDAARRQVVDSFSAEAMWGAVADDLRDLVARRFQ